MGGRGRWDGQRGDRRKNRAYLLPRLFSERLERRLLLAVSPAPASSQAVQLFHTSPAVFVENAGQWADSSVRFVHQGDGANIALTDAGASFQLFRENPWSRMGPFASAAQALEAEHAP